MAAPSPTVSTDPSEFTPGDHVQVSIDWPCGCHRTEHRIRLADGGWQLDHHRDQPHLVENLCADHHRQLQHTGTRPQR